MSHACARAALGSLCARRVHTRALRAALEIGPRRGRILGARAWAGSIRRGRSPLRNSGQPEKRLERSLSRRPLDVPPTLNLVQENNVTIHRVVNRLGQQIMSGESMKVAGNSRVGDAYGAPSRGDSLRRAAARSCRHAERSRERCNPPAKTLSLSPDVLLEPLAVLIAAADGEIDEFEVETIAQFVESLGLEDYSAADLQDRARCERERERAAARSPTRRNSAKRCAEPRTPRQQCSSRSPSPTRTAGLPSKSAGSSKRWARALRSNPFGSSSSRGKSRCSRGSKVRERYELVAERLLLLRATTAPNSNHPSLEANALCAPSVRLTEHGPVRGAGVGVAPATQRLHG